MTPEDKELLIRDLCARLPYGVKFKHKDWDVPLGLTRIHKTVKYGTFVINERIFENDFDTLKPYLRKMSSMTEREKISYRKTQWEYQADYCAPEYFDGLESYDWLNAHHFDYRGLIEKGLALEAPKGMYK